MRKKPRGKSRTSDLRSALGSLASKLAWVNIELWHEEDKARTDDDHVVARAKRNVDSLNQRRNDLIEKIDRCVIDTVGARKR